MRTYQEYKDSNIQWWQEIPSHWSMMSLRHSLELLTDYAANGSFADLRNNVTYLDEPDYSRLVRLTDLRVNFENAGVYVDKHSHEFLKKSELFGGEILIANIGAYAGYVCRMPNFGTYATLGPNMYILRFDKARLRIEFAYYLLISDPCQKQLQLKATSTAQPKLNKDDVKSLFISVPPLPEQQAIADFLDRKTAQIDTFIEKKQRQIDLLQEQRKAIINHAFTKGLNPNALMMNSGVEWLGDVPSHWQILALKTLLQEGNDGIKIGPFGSSLKLEIIRTTGYKVYGQGNVINDDFEWGHRYIDDDKFSEMSAYELFPNDIMITMMGTTGKSKVVPERIKKGIFDSHIIRIRVNHKTFPEYISRLINDSYYIYTQVKLNSKGSIMEGLNTTIVKSFIVALPPLTEQESIVHYLTTISSQFEKTRSKLQTEIELAQEYRTVLISETVTGKIDVR